MGCDLTQNCLNFSILDPSISLEDLKKNDCLFATPSFNNYNARFHVEEFLVIYHYANFGTIPASS